MPQPDHLSLWQYFPSFFCCFTSFPGYISAVEKIISWNEIFVFFKVWLNESVICIPESSSKTKFFEIASFYYRAFMLQSHVSVIEQYILNYLHLPYSSYKFASLTSSMSNIFCVDIVTLLIQSYKCNNYFLTITTWYNQILIPIVIRHHYKHFCILCIVVICHTGWWIFLLGKLHFRHTAAIYSIKYF